jgi:hypothetical protein
MWILLMCMFCIIYLISNPVDILTNILIHGTYVYMYLFMCMIIKLGILSIQEQRNKSLTVPCRQGVNLGLREGILNALYIFKFCILQL